MGRPKKIKHPVGLADFLRIVLPEKRPELRRKIFREWRRKILAAEFKREPTDQEVDAEIKGFHEGKYSAAFIRFGFADSLKDFVPAFHQENRRKKARLAASARWAKENR
jgi:hypothetical protein